MLWGHKIRTAEGQIEVNRARFNAGFGVATPPKPEVPEYLLYIWEAWWRLNARRQPADPVCPVQFTEIEAFGRLTEDPFTPEDLRMIEAIDDAYIRAVAEEVRARSERDSNKPPPAKSKKR